MKKWQVKEIRAAFRFKFKKPLSLEEAVKLIAEYGYENCIEAIAKSPFDVKEPLKYIRAVLGGAGPIAEEAVEEAPVAGWQADFYRMYITHVPGVLEWDSEEAPKYDIEGGTDLERYREKYLEWSRRMAEDHDFNPLDEEPEFFEDPPFPLPVSLVSGLHWRARRACIYGYLVFKEEVEYDREADSSQEKGDGEGEIGASMPMVSEEDIPW